MTNVNIYEVSETYNMIEREKLDMRTITLGISLLERVDSDLKALDKETYKKITTLAKNLVSTGQNIEVGFSISTVNKRTSVAPIVLVDGSACRRPEGFVIIARTLDMAAKEVGVNFIGDYSVLVSKGMTRADKNLTLSIPQVLFQTERVCSSVSIGSTKIGINMNAVRLMGGVVTETAEATRNHDSLGCTKLVMFCSAPDDSSFMVDAFHGVTEPEAVINVGVSDPGVVKVALTKVRDANFEVLCEIIKRTTFKVTHVGQPVAQEASRRMGIPFGIIDSSLALMPLVRDGVTEILGEIGLERVSAPGATAALAMFNGQVKKGGVMASSYVGGLSGAFISVSEDQGVIDVVSMGALAIERLEAMTCVCSIGSDMIAIPSDTPSSTIAGVIAGEATIGMANQEMTAVRLIPAVGKKIGETAEFGGLLGYTPIMSVNTLSRRRFVVRSGRIPALIRSSRN